MKLLSCVLALSLVLSSSFSQSYSVTEEQLREIERGKKEMMTQVELLNELVKQDAVALKKQEKQIKWYKTLSMIFGVSTLTMLTVSIARSN